jgi:hypothetical protein
VPFFLDTQQIIPEVESDADFYHVLTREMLAQLPTSLPGTAPPFIASERFTAETPRRLLGFIHEVAPGKTPVLLFDELENLEFKLNRGSVSADLLLFLAGLLDGDVPVSFVATGSDQLEDLEFSGWSILYTKTIARRIGLLAPKDALQLINEPVRGYVLYDEGVPDRILRLTAGHAYFTQVVCQAIVDYLNERHDFHVSLDKLSEVVELVLNNPPPPLTYMWKSLSSLEKTTVAGIAQALSDADGHADVDQIIGGLPPELVELAEGRANVAGALNQLRREDWIETHRDQSKCRFRLDLLRLWIRREHSVWQVADELRSELAT